MRREATRILAAASLGGMLLLPLACSSLSEEECRAARSEAFEIVNKAHTCNNDTECLPTEWPGCARPASLKAAAKLQPIRDKFLKGECKDPDASACPDTPVVYCKQGLCVFRHRAGEAGATAKPATSAKQ